MQRLNPSIVHRWWLIDSPFQFKYWRSNACSRHGCPHAPRDVNKPACKQCAFSLTTAGVCKVVRLLTEEEECKD